MSIEKIERELRVCAGLFRLEKDDAYEISLSDANRLVANIYLVLAEFSRLREALKGIRDAANSFQDEEGYEVAAQIRIRVDAAISEREGQDG